jgi:MOSC domain-containing protein YiiM/ferredoxin-NADP reductase
VLSQISEKRAVPRLLSVNVGLPRDVAWRGKTVHTAIWKAPVPGRRMVRRLNIDGDGQGDLVGHGGDHRAVFVYQIEAYRYWEEQLRRTDFSYGQFGENFTIEGLSDDEVCIGDRYQIGSALFEVTQPRVTCYRVGIRMNEPRMAALLTASGKPGFYFRVLQEGEVAAGDPIVKVAEARGRMSVAEINALLYLPGHPRSQLKRALRIPALSNGWRASFQALLKSEEAGASGNAGLSAAAAAPRAAPGFLPLTVARMTQESVDVISLLLEPRDGRSLAMPLPGQFIVLRLRPTPDGPPLFRSYSLSGPPSRAGYRISVKIEAHGRAGPYLSSRVRVGDVLDASTPRGSFVLRAGDGPVVLLSAGIGATPVLAMLHSLAASGAARQVWWLYGARSRKSHPFADDVRRLIASLAKRRRSGEEGSAAAPGAPRERSRRPNHPGRIQTALLGKITPAVTEGTDRARNDALHLLFRADAHYRRGPLRTARRHSGALSGDRPLSGVRLPGLPGCMVQAPARPRLTERAWRTARSCVFSKRHFRPGCAPTQRAGPLERLRCDQQPVTCRALRRAQS